MSEQSPPQWDESTRPVAPPLGGPPPANAAVGQHLVDVHDHLRRELDELHDLVRQVEQARITAAEARADINRMTLRQNDWTLGAYCSSYCRLLTGHHSLEDAAIFPHLRGSAPGLAPVVDRLAEEHHVIHGMLEDLDRALVAFINAPADTTPLRQALRTLTDALLSHLAYEEQQLVPALERYGFYPDQLA